MTRPRFPDSALLSDPPEQSGRGPSRLAAATETEFGFETRRGPTAVYTPQGYEPGYAYPLLVWFHGAGRDERSLHAVMPLVSDRNALGLALRGERAVESGGFDWSPLTRPAERAEALFAAVRGLRRDYHVHSERVVLAGSGAAAVAAAGVFFARPEWFGGLAVFDPPADCPPHRGVTELADANPQAVGKPALLGVTRPGRSVRRDLADRFAATGTAVSDCRAGRPADALGDLNRWLMASVCGVA